LFISISAKPDWIFRARDQNDEISMKIIADFVMDSVGIFIRFPAMTTSGRLPGSLLCIGVEALEKVLNGARIALFGQLFYYAEEENSLSRVSRSGQMSTMKSKKDITLFLAILFLVLPLFPQADDLLKVEASISPGRLSRGQAGRVILKFSIQDGLTINPLPSFTVEIGPSDELVFSKNFFSASDLEIEILEEDGKEYLDLSRQIEIPFTVSDGAERGIHNMEGKIKFFAVSINEDWCLKTTASFSASFYIRVSSQF